MFQQLLLFKFKLVNKYDLLHPHTDIYLFLCVIKTYVYKYRTFCIVLYVIHVTIAQRCLSHQRLYLSHNVDTFNDSILSLRIPCIFKKNNNVRTKFVEYYEEKLKIATYLGSNE